MFVFVLIDFCAAIVSVPIWLSWRLGEQRFSWLHTQFKGQNCDLYICWVTCTILFLEMEKNQNQRNNRIING